MKITIGRLCLFSANKKKKLKEILVCTNLLKESHVSFVSVCKFQFHFLEFSVPGWEQSVILGIVDLRSVVVPYFFCCGSFFLSNFFFPIFFFLFEFWREKTRRVLWRSGSCFICYAL